MAKKENNDLEKRNQAFLIYQDENGIARVNVRFDRISQSHKVTLIIKSAPSFTAQRTFCP